MKRIIATKQLKRWQKIDRLVFAAPALGDCHEREESGGNGGGPSFHGAGYGYHLFSRGSNMARSKPHGEKDGDSESYISNQ